MTTAHPTIIEAGGAEALLEPKPGPQVHGARAPLDTSDRGAVNGLLPRIGRTRVSHWVYIWSAMSAGLAAMWALWPLGDRSIQHDGPSSLLVTDGASQTNPPALEVAALDINAFRAPIWVLPPEPPAPPPAPEVAPPPPPLKLQLLAITREVGATEDGILRATLYDPDTDRLLIVASGEKIGDRTVERITPHQIALAGPDGKRTLSLADVPQSSSSPGGRR